MINIFQLCHFNEFLKKNEIPCSFIDEKANLTLEIKFRKKRIAVEC